VAGLLGGHGRGPAEARAAGAGGVQSLTGALDDQFENSAGAAKTWKTSRPPAVAVSRASAGS
jgi:hypothetical protein